MRPRCALSALVPRRRARRGRCRATSCCGRYPAVRHRRRRCRAATCPCSSSTASSRSRFGRKLQYLADNGYVTLSADEYFAGPDGHAAGARRARCVLTFDDGRGSLWSVGQPLLRRYGMKGHRVPRARPHAVAAGTAAPDLGRRRRRGAIAGRRSSAARAATAPSSPGRRSTPSPARASSTSRATPSPTRASTPRPQVVGFLTPALRHGYAAMDVPLDRRATAATCWPPRLPLGTPLLRSAAADLGGAALLRGPGRPRAPAWRRWRAEGEALLRAAGLGGAGSGAWSPRRASPAAARRPRSARRAIRRELAGGQAADRGAHGPRRSCTSAIRGTPPGPTARRLARRGGLPHGLLRQGRRASPITLPGRRSAWPSRASARTTSSCCPAAGAPTSVRGPAPEVDGAGCAAARSTTPSLLDDRHAARPASRQPAPARPAAARTCACSRRRRWPWS